MLISLDQIGLSQLLAVTSCSEPGLQEPSTYLAPFPGRADLPPRWIMVRVALAERQIVSASNAGLRKWRASRVTSKIWEFDLPVLYGKKRFGFALCDACATLRALRAMPAIRCGATLASSKSIADGA